MITNSPTFSAKHEERMRRFLEAGIYLVTSRSASAGRSTLEIVQASLAGGVRLIQIREKDLSAKELITLSEKAQKLTNEAGALLIINDLLDVALEVDADGTHLGQDDLPLIKARKMAPDLIIGVSAHTTQQAVEAQKLGASYVNIGPLFPTQTKKWDKEFLGLDGLRKISKAISIPFTVMGGIKKQHIPELLSAGARTIAVITAITAAENPERAARELLNMTAKATAIP